MRRLVPLVCVCVCATWAIARPHAAATDLVFSINAV